MKNALKMVILGVVIAVTLLAGIVLLRGIDHASNPANYPAAEQIMYQKEGGQI